MEIEVNVPETEITGKDISVETGNTSIAISEDTKDLDITYNRKEYSIIGDGIFISSVLDDAPPWLKEFIDTTISVAVTDRDQSLIDRLHAILSLLDYVPKNQYTEQINQIVSEDGIINSRIATLNSYLEGAIHSTNATIAEINLTYASKDEAAAIATNVLTASLSGSGEIGSTLIQLQEAYANLESTTAESIILLESVMEGVINGNASAMQTIRSYVGIDEAGASTGTGLSAYLEDSNGVIGGADSQLNNTIKVTAEGIESKFAYNSVVNINGIYKKSGFGLTTNYTSGNGTQANPYASEFWIDASRLKFTNSNQTGQVAPFTIDATGATPQITFNGKVAFTNVTGYTPPTNLSEFVNDSGYVLPTGVAAAVNSNTTTINGSKITTGSIYAAQIAANTITSDKISTYNLTAANSTFQNSIITNAAIANAAITNAKIGDAQITTAKIGDAQITNAKIGTASIDTLNIQGEAVVVTRYAEGVGDLYPYQPNFGKIHMYYTPTVSHGAVFNFSGDTITNSMTLYINGVALSAGASGINSGTRYTYLYAGTAYTISLYGVRYNYTAGDGETFEPRYKHLTMIGAKR